MPRRITSTLCAGMLLVVLGSAVVHWLAHRIGGSTLNALDRLTGYDQSGMLPAVYASFMLLACSAALGCIAHIKFVRGGIFVRHWGMLALLFAVLGTDKILGVHHRLMPLARNIQAMLHVSNVMVFVGVGFAGLLAYTVYARFLRCLAPSYRRQFLFAAAIFCGAIFYDKLGSLFISRLNDGALLTQLLLAFEDMLEIGGAVLFLHALLQYMAELGLSLAFPRRAEIVSPTTPEMAPSTVDFSPKPQ